MCNQPPLSIAGYTADNEGANGATTADWAELHGGSLLADALIIIGKYAITQVEMMLGTNDANLDNVDAATYQSNMQSIITTLVGAGITTIVINQPPYIQTVTNPTANTLLVDYHTANANLVTANPGVVTLGDTTAFSVFQAHPEYYQGDGVHPNDTGATALASLWAASYPV